LFTTLNFDTLFKKEISCKGQQNIGGNGLLGTSLGLDNFLTL
jgi:hypothetical protein